MKLDPEERKSCKDIRFRSAWTSDSSLQEQLALQAAGDDQEAMLTAIALLQNVAVTSR